MSNVTTRRFVVISQSVNTSDDVFNNLVEVKDKATGEQGLLLCSHMCSFPPELISQATWLEGCKTPEVYKDEPRLALGYHPDQYTQWRVFKKTNEIEIYLTGSSPQEIWHTVALPYHPIRNDVPRHIKSSVVRLCVRTLTHTPTQETLNSFECLIHRLFNSGKISAWQATFLPHYISVNTNVNLSQVHWTERSILFYSILIDNASSEEEQWRILQEFRENID